LLDQKDVPWREKVLKELVEDLNKEQTEDGQPQWKIYGYKKKDALGKNYVNLFVGELEGPDSISDCDSVIDEGKVFRNFLATDIANDGSKRVMLTNCFRIWDDQQKEYLQAEIGLDVSELEKSEERYRTLREMALEQQDKNERLKLLERLRKISTIITSAIIYEEKGLQKILEQIVCKVDELIGEKTHSIICLYGNDKKDDNYSICIYNRPFSENTYLQNENSLIGLGKFTISTIRPYFIDPNNERPTGFPVPFENVPFAVMPLMSRDTGLGILYVQLDKGYIFTDDVKEVLQLFADQAVIAVQNARLIQNLRSLNIMVAEKQEILTRSQIAVDFAHRMNNMAAPFIIWVDLIREELGNSGGCNFELVQEYLDEIKNQSKDLLHEAKKIEQIPDEEDIDIKEMLEAMVRNVKIQSRLIEVNLIAGQKLRTVKAIRSLLSNAVWNVISNSLDAMDNRGKLIFKARNITRNKKAWVELVVQDTGPGIPAESQVHIFEINYSTKGIGHGYGLWRTKQIVEGIGGEIQLSVSNQKDGTAFTFLLPASK
jgi:signal transduction histidine kinase